MNKLGLTATLLASASALAFVGGINPYGQALYSLTPGFNAAGDSLQMLGPPSGEGLHMGSADIYQLGVQGEVVIELGDPAANGPGTDLIIYENPFLAIGGADSETWVEALKVEVSSNSEDWAGFDNSYLGTAGPFGLFQPIPMHWFRGFAGVSPVAAHPVLGVDPADIVLGGGDVFDLQDLVDHPNVVSQLVDLEDIRYVRLTDIQGGVSTDSAGGLIWDCGDVNFACSDVDAVYVANNSNFVPFGRPTVELSMEEFPGGTFMVLEISDPNGLWHVIPTITASSNGVPGNFYNLLQYFAFLELDDFHVKMAAGPVIPQLPPTQFRVSATDITGQTSGDAIYFP